MFDLGAFFRRNRKVLWFAIAAFMVTFVSIQVSKALATRDSNYGEIAECTYVHQAPELQTPLTQQEPVNKYCAKKG
ncbi:MAG: hypothetical protein AB1516_11090 [Pseudomonadota bacterium]